MANNHNSKWTQREPDPPSDKSRTLILERRAREAKFKAVGMLTLAIVIAFVISLQLIGWNRNQNSDANATSISITAEDN